MITCLVEGLQAAVHKAVNSDKLKEISQRADENPAVFLARLQEALQQFTNLNPDSLEGILLPHMHFISQSAPDICQKLQKLQAGPQTSQNELVNLAFKIFNNRVEEEAQQERQREEAKSHNQANQLLASALKKT